MNIVGIEPTFPLYSKESPVAPRFSRLARLSNFASGWPSGF
jgi:hypothetical protein